MTLQHVIKINGQVKTVKAAHPTMLHLADSTTIHLQKHFRYTAKEVSRSYTGKFRSCYVLLG